MIWLSLALRGTKKIYLVNSQSIVMMNSFMCRVVDEIVEDIACSLKVPRCALHIYASGKGIFFGDVQVVMKNGHLLDGQRDVILHGHKICAKHCRCKGL